jgi:hypothetical protein
MSARALFLGVGLALALGTPAAAAPVVFWMSEPVEPGGVVLLQGGDLDGVREVRVWRLPDGDPGSPPAAAPAVPGASASAARVPAIQPAGGSLKFVLPAGLTPGVFGVDVGGGARALGRPQVDWAQSTRLGPGVQANEAVPGTPLQLVGRNFSTGAAADDGARPRVRVVLRSADGRVAALAVTAADRYSVVATVPGDLAAGDYTAWVHSGAGGAAGWGGGLPVHVARATAWPAQTVSVRELGAKGDGVTDDSEALRRALAAVERRGGGIVVFPAGTYRLSGVFKLPRRVVLRGAGKDLTWLKWPFTAPASAADFVPAVLSGTGEFGIERLSLMVRNAQTVVRNPVKDGGNRDKDGKDGKDGRDADKDGPRDVFLRELRIHYLPWSGRPSNNPERDPQWAFSRWGVVNGTDRDLAILLQGVDTVEISDCEVVGGARVLDVRNGRFTGNHFLNAQGMEWVDLGGEHLVLTKNRVDGVASWRPGALPLRWLYGADNTTRNLGRGEREAFTFDVNRGLGAWREGRGRVEPWVGPVASASGRTVRLGKGDVPAGAYRGFDALVVGGRGAGQFREIEDNDGQSLRVARDWDVEPDGSSVVLVSRLMRHCVFQRNTAEDVSAFFQMWGPLYDCTFDGNTVARSQGMWGLGGWRIQWLGNVLDGAVSYHTSVGPTGSTPERTAEYGYVGFTTSGRLAEMGRFEYARAAVIRGNHLSHGHRVLVMGGYGGPRKSLGFVAARDIVVDGNRIADSPVGIELDANVEGAVVAGNAFTQVEEPLRLAAPTKVHVIQAPAAPRAPGAAEKSR